MRNTIEIILSLLIALLAGTSAFHLSKPLRSPYGTNEKNSPQKSFDRQLQLSGSAMESLFGWLPGYPRYNSKKDKKSIDAGALLEEVKSVVDEANSAMAEAEAALAMEIDEPALDWSRMTVPMLKKELKSRGLMVSGKKADLIARLEAHMYDAKEEEEEEKAIDISDVTAVKSSAETPPADNEVVEVAAATTGTDSADNYDKMKVAELKTELRNKGLTVGGKKADLIERLKAHSSNDSQKDSLHNDTPVECIEILDAPTDTQVENIEIIDAPTDYKTFTVAQLKSELRSKGLKIGGKKADLIERLKEVSAA